MALINCRECGKEISTDAKACPGCGAEPRRISVLSILVVCFIAFAGYQATRTVHDPVKAASPVETSNDDQKNKTAREDVAFDFGKMMRRVTRDPDSLVFEYVNTNIDGTIICAAFRAKNGFGGYSKETAVYVNGTERRAPKDIKIFCPAATHDLKYMTEH